MSFLVNLLLPFITCAVMAGATAFLWARTLGNPGLFGITALLLTLGLHRVLQVGVEFIKLFTGSGYFLEARNKPTVDQLVKESLNTETVVLCVLLVAIGLPLLQWVRTAMVKV